jgi:CheY-like chemotaxis protein
MQTGGRPAEQPYDTSASEETAEPRQLAAPAPASEQRRRRLLVIEERPRGLLTLVAERAVADLAYDSDDPHGGIDIITAVGAQEAASTLAADPCHCVVLELGMRHDEGADFLAAMRGDSALASVPVLIHTGHRVNLGQEQGLRALAGDRPLDFLASLDDLRERITLHLSAEQPGDVLSLVRSDEPQRTVAQVVDDAFVGRTVLVVDDDARNLFALSGVLELHGFHVLHADNGRKGIEMLLAHPDISLVLMDVMMPEMDGYAATTEIRSMPQYAQLPIIAVTAKAMPGDQEKSLASGANDYVTKPVDTGDLIARVRRWLPA